MQWSSLVFILLVGLIIALPLLPFENSPKSVVVLSGSMEPAVKTGSLVITLPAVVSDVQKGDIISFRSHENENNIILHRVVDISNESGSIFFTTKGDNNDGTDNEPVPARDLVGKQLLSLPYLGRLVNFMRTPVGFLFLIFTPALIFVILRLLDLKKALDDKDTKDNSKKHTAGNVKVLAGIWMTIFIMMFFGSANAWALFSESVSLEGVEFETYHLADTVVINEFLWKSTCKHPEDKFWIELWNGVSSVVDLNGWRLRDGNNHVTVISNDSVLIQQNDFLLLVKSNSTFNPQCEGHNDAEKENLPGNPDFSTESTNGILYLEKPDGEGGFRVVDTIFYGSGGLDSEDGGSIERMPLAHDSAIGEDFVESDFIVHNASSKTPGT